MPHRLWTISAIGPVDWCGLLKVQSVSVTGCRQQAGVGYIHPATCLHSLSPHNVRILQLTQPLAGKCQRRCCCSAKQAALLMSSSTNFQFAAATVAEEATATRVGCYWLVQSHCAIGNSNAVLAADIKSRCTRALHSHAHVQPCNGTSSPAVHQSSLMGHSGAIGTAWFAFLH
jgi:hypothetical protein